MAVTRRCPEDGAALEPRVLHGLNLDVCPVCAGLFFDEGEIAALSAQGPGALSDVERAAAPSDLVVLGSVAHKRCPHCDRPMHAYAYRYSSAIRLDGCEGCGGVWVGDGELAKIAAYLRSEPAAQGGTPAARRAAESLNAAVRHAITLRAVSSFVP